LRKQIVEHKKDIRKSMLRSQRLENAVKLEPLTNNDSPSDDETQKLRNSNRTTPQPVAIGLLSCRPKSVYYVPSLSTDDLMGPGSRLSVYGYYGMDDLVALANNVDTLAYLKSNEESIPQTKDEPLVEKQVLPPPEISPLDDMELMDLDGRNIVLERELVDNAEGHHRIQFKVWLASIDDHPIVVRQIAIPVCFLR